MAGYLGGFMGGSPDYNGNPGILGLYQFVQSGYDAGKAKAQNQALAQLSQKAYTDTGDAQKQDIAQAIGIDPQMGYALAGKAQAQQAAQQAQQQQMLERYGKAASAILQAKQSGDDAAAEGIYQAMMPELQMHAAQTGQPPPPPTLDASVMPTVYKLASMYASIPQAAKGVVVSAGGAVVNPATGKQMYRNPYGMKYENVPMGAGQAAGAFDPNTGTVRPATGGAPQMPVQGAPQPPSPGMNQTVPGANGQSVQFNFPPGTPPEVIAAAKASAVANGDIAPGALPQAAGVPQAVAAPAQFGVGTKGASTDLIAQRQQQIQQLKAAGVDMSPEDAQQYLLTGKASNFQGGSSAALFGDPSKTGPEYLKTIPQGNQEIVRGLLDGTVSLPTGTTLKSPLWQSALASVKHADPAWNQAAFKQYADTRKWATTGQGGQLINNINTASYHLDKLRADIQALHNGNFSLINKIGNTVSQATGGQAVTNFKADLTPVASELAAVYKGKGVPSDAEIAHFMNALTPDMSYGQQMNVIRGWIDLLTGKLNSTREQYRSGMSKLSSPLSVINPHAAEALERITTLANQVSNTGQHPMPAQDTSPIYAPGQQPAAAAAGASSGATATNGDYSSLWSQ